MNYTLAQLSGKVVGTGTEEWCQGVALANKDKGLFSIKMKDTAIEAAVEFLKNKVCIFNFVLLFHLFSADD